MRFSNLSIMQQAKVSSIPRQNRVLALRSALKKKPKNQTSNSLYQQRIQSQFQQNVPLKPLSLQINKSFRVICRVCSLRMYKNLSYNNFLSQLMCHTSMKRSNLWRSWNNTTKNKISGEKGKTYQNTISGEKKESFTSLLTHDWQSTKIKQHFQCCLRRKNPLWSALWARLSLLGPCSS